jgi:hypothetical protein
MFSVWMYTSIELLFASFFHHGHAWNRPLEGHKLAVEGGRGASMRLAGGGARAHHRGRQGRELEGCRSLLLLMCGLFLRIRHGQQRKLEGWRKELEARPTEGSRGAAWPSSPAPVRQTKEVGGR